MQTEATPSIGSVKGIEVDKGSHPGPDYEGYCTLI